MKKVFLKLLIIKLNKYKCYKKNHSGPHSEGRPRERRHKSHSEEEPLIFLAPIYYLLGEGVGEITDSKRVHNFWI
jgi:hypothetical protein